MHYRRKIFQFSRRRGKLCPGAGKKSHSFAIEEKCVGFPGAGGSCVPAPESSGARFWRGSECRFFPAPGETVSRRRESCFPEPGHCRRKMCRFSRRRRRGSCVPAPGKPFPGALESSHSFTVKEKCVSFPGAGGSCVPAPGKLFPGAVESCVAAPGKLFLGVGERLAGRRLV